MSTYTILPGLILALQTSSNPFITTFNKQFPIFPLFILLSLLQEAESSQNQYTTTQQYTTHNNSINNLNILLKMLAIQQLLGKFNICPLRFFLLMRSFT